MLYQSLHVHEGEEPSPRSVLEKADIAHYLRDFGSSIGDDAQLCVGVAGERIGGAGVESVAVSLGTYSPDTRQ